MTSNFFLHSCHVLKKKFAKQKVSSTHLEEGYVVRNKTDINDEGAKITTYVRPPYFGES